MRKANLPLIAILGAAALVSCSTPSEDTREAAKSYSTEESCAAAGTLLGSFLDTMVEYRSGEVSEDELHEFEADLSEKWTGLGEQSPEGLRPLLLAAGDTSREPGLETNRDYDQALGEVLAKCESSGFPVHAKVTHGG